MNSTTTSAVVMEGVGFAYNGAPVLQEVDLDIAVGSFVVLVGPNGGGKTTLLKLMLGLIQPGQGRVTVLGASPKRARSRVGYVPQHIQVDPHFPVTVMDVVLMGRLGRTGLFGPYSLADRAVASEALARLDMDHLTRRPFSELSGGQRQRVLIARAMVCEPSLLLLDEPVAGMDLVGEHELFAMLQDLQPDITVLLVTHDLGFVSAHFNQAICVNRQVRTHPTAELGGESISKLYGRPMRLVQHGHELDHLGVCSLGDHHD